MQSSLPAIAEIRSVLLVQLGDIGDVVLTAPSLLAVKQTYPAARVSILVRKPYGSLLSSDPNVDGIFEVEKLRGFVGARLRKTLELVRRLRGANFDLVVDLRTGDRGALLSFLTGARCRVGRQTSGSPRWRDWLFTKIVRDVTVAPLPVHPGADQSLRILREIGIRTSDSTPKLHVAPENRERAAALLTAAGLGPTGAWVTISPCSRWKYKEWSPEKWRKVADHLWQSRGLPAVFVGSPEDSKVCADIIARLAGRAVNLAGLTTLGELAAVLMRSRLHLGVDTSAPHIAAAVGTPTVTIHGPSNWRAWRVEDDLHKVVWEPKACVPCNRKGCNDSLRSECLEDLQPARVIAAADEVLRKLALAV